MIAGERIRSSSYIWCQRWDYRVSGRRFGGGSGGYVVNPDGINYSFADIDSPNGNVKFTLRDKLNPTIKYCIEASGDPGFELIKITFVGTLVSAASVPISFNNYQFMRDGYFRIKHDTNPTYHAITVPNGQPYIGPVTASNPAVATFQAGFNFKLENNYIYFIDNINGTWFIPWVTTAFGAPVLEFDAG